MLCGVITTIGIVTTQAYQKNTTWMIWTGAMGMVALVGGAVYIRVCNNSHRCPGAPVEYEQI